MARRKTVTKRKPQKSVKRRRAVKKARAVQSRSRGKRAGRAPMVAVRPSNAKVDSPRRYGRAARSAAAKRGWKTRRRNRRVAARGGQGKRRLKREREERRSLRGARAALAGAAAPLPYAPVETASLAQTWPGAKLPRRIVVSPSGEMDDATYPETRFFASGASFLGYIEGRPGVKGILSVLPVEPGKTRPTPKARGVAERAEIRARIAAADPVREEIDEHAADEGDDDDFAAEVVQRYVDLYDLIDDDGALVEIEVDKDSGGSEGA